MSRWKGEPMGSALITLAAAVAGGLITLISVLLTQRSAERLRREEHERADRHRLEDRKHARDSQLLEGRKASYAKMNAAARTARDALVSCSIELRETGGVEPGTLATLDSVWATYVSQHAEAHMTVSDEVLDALGSVNGSLRQMYGLVQKLCKGTPDREAAMGELERRTGELWDRLTFLRDEMRRDLGITSSTRQPDLLQDPGWLPAQNLNQSPPPPSP
ncbi:hypothetical protein [Streptomyces virginiae]|uniref:hypothetical protein n=1 Tax=Streptomyces virginiae TaxID=1961 RepID=UPI002252230F|nr:hypothetical protein [Streptomyces virginiae]MCX5173993.1 hypothetical protein [Streptomyces virginiae]